jgi:hypothetical protein
LEVTHHRSQSAPQVNQMDVSALVTSLLFLGASMWLTYMALRGEHFRYLRTDHPMPRRTGRLLSGIVAACFFAMFVVTLLW